MGALPERSASQRIEVVHLTVYSHDSGLCAVDAVTKARFARDLRNLTLASPAVNCHQKSDKDAAEWVPARNRCWFAVRILEVWRAYGLTIDRREAAALDRIFAACASTALEAVVCAVPSESGNVPERGSTAGGDALARYDDNRNGMITCKEDRRHGIAPVPRSHAAYRHMRDGDRDGVVCEWPSRGRSSRFHPCASGCLPSGRRRRLGWFWNVPGCGFWTVKVGVCRLRRLRVRLLLSACPLVRRIGRYVSSWSRVRGLPSALRSWSMSYGLAGWRQGLMPFRLEDCGRWLITKTKDSVRWNSRPMPVHGGDSAYRRSSRCITFRHWGSPVRCTARTL